MQGMNKTGGEHAKKNAASTQISGRSTKRFSKTICALLLPAGLAAGLTAWVHGGTQSKPLLDVSLPERVQLLRIAEHKKHTAQTGVTANPAVDLATR